MITRLNYSQLKSLPVKQPCYVATTSDISDLLASAPDTIDGVLLSVGNRVLVKNQINNFENGIYIVESVGTGNDGSWKRSIDGSIDDDFLQGIQVYINKGTQNGGKTFVLESSEPIQLGVTGLTFSLYSSGPGITQSLTADNGLEIVSNTIYLGGTLSQNTTINGSEYNFTIGSADIILFTSSVFDVESDGFISLDAGTGSVQILGDDAITIAASGSMGILTNGLMDIEPDAAIVIASSPKI
jgi:hypothetical protein